MSFNDMLIYNKEILSDSLYKLFKSVAALKFPHMSSYVLVILFQKTLM